MLAASSPKAEANVLGVVNVTVFANCAYTPLVPIVTRKAIRKKSLFMLILFELIIDLLYNHQLFLIIYTKKKYLFMNANSLSLRSYNFNAKNGISFESRK